MTEPKIMYQPHGDPICACWCAYCDWEWRRFMNNLNPDGFWFQGMILCPDCGNKRCPKASCHDHECTGSNEPGQHGSTYGDYRLPEDQEDQELADHAGASTRGRWSAGRGGEQ